MTTPSPPQKIYCYVDETGQDPRGNHFVVVTVIMGQEREKLRTVLEQIESSSRKGKKKWTRATAKQRQAYLEDFVQVNQFRHKIYFSKFPKPADYLTCTIQAIQRAIHAVAGDQPVVLTLLIDGLQKQVRGKVRGQLRSPQITIRKVRGLTDESDEFIRLADAVAGLVRSHLEKRPYVETYYRRGVRRGIIKRL